MVGSSLILNTGITKLEAGANYVATTDEDVFNINVLHKQFNISNLFADFNDNTIVPL